MNKNNLFVALLFFKDGLEFVLKCLEKSLKEYLYKCHRYHCFCRFRQEFVINSEPSIVFQP